MPCLHFVSQSIKHKAFLTDAYTPGTSAFPQPMPQEMMPAKTNLEKLGKENLIKAVTWNIQLLFFVMACLLALKKKVIKVTTRETYLYKL